MRTVYEDDVVATLQDLLVCDGERTRHTAKLVSGFVDGGNRCVFFFLLIAPPVVESSVQVCGSFCWRGSQGSASIGSDAIRHRRLDRRVRKQNKEKTRHREEGGQFGCDAVGTGRNSITFMLCMGDAIVCFVAVYERCSWLCGRHISSLHGCNGASSFASRNQWDYEYERGNGSVGECGGGSGTGARTSACGSLG